MVNEAQNKSVPVTRWFPSEELDYWRRYLKSKGLNWHEQVKKNGKVRLCRYSFDILEGK